MFVIEFNIFAARVCKAAERIGKLTMKKFEPLDLDFETRVRESFTRPFKKD